MLISPGRLRILKLATPAVLATTLLAGCDNGSKISNTSKNAVAESFSSSEPFGSPVEVLNSGSEAEVPNKPKINVQINPDRPNMARFSFTNLNAIETPIPKGLKIVGDTQLKKPIFEGRYGEWVSVREIMTQEIRKSDWEEIKANILKHKTVLIISKKYNLHFLAVDGKIINHGPIGTAHKNNFKDIKMGTPAGTFRIHRQEGPWHESGEFESADMGYASYFSDFSTGKDQKNGFNIGRNLDAMRGIAIHSSDPRTSRDRNNLPVKFKINASHGCVNALREDAKRIQQYLKLRDYVVVLE